MNMGTQLPKTVRSVVYTSLLRCERQKSYSNLELDNAVKNNSFSDVDRSLLTTLLYGVLERKITLDAWLAPLSKRPYHELCLEMQTILRLGAYQIYYLDRVPDYAAVDESVELCKTVLPKAAGYVNALLRSFLRNKEQLSYPEPKDVPIDYLSVRYSVSKPLCEMWVKNYDFERTERILQASFSNPPLSLRVNTLKITREDFIALLEKQGIRACKTEQSVSGVHLLDKIAISEFSAFEQGLCFVQDEASQVTAQILGAKKGEMILDACACPGGKSFSIAMDMQNEGILYSCDLHANKLSLVSKGAQRMGITCLQVIEQNGAQHRPDFVDAMDRVLCDVPCSGLGVLAKKPELRYKSTQEWERLPQIQKAILQNCCSYVKPGGILLYSTCTLNPEENEGVIQAFLQENPSFLVEKIHTFFPDQGQTDGFFFCKMKRKKTRV